MKELRSELIKSKHKINFALEIIYKEQEKINLLINKIDSLERRHQRNLADWKQFAKDLSSHPVTGNITPNESAELLVMSLCKRDAGC
jgi:hypothetical protein